MESALKIELDAMELLPGKNNSIEIPVPDAGLVLGIAGRHAVAIDRGLTPDAVRKQEKKILQSLTGIESRNILFLNQVHGGSIMVIDAYPEKDSIVIGDADSIVTNLPGLCPVIRTADCVPVIAFDRIKKTLGAAHSGWRGTELAISAKMILLMMERFNCRPEDMSVFILPSIGPESFEVNMDVASRFPGFYRQIKGGTYLDMWSAIRASLTDAGIPGKNIFTSGICNYIHNDRFFSHRRGDAGRNADRDAE